MQARAVGRIVASVAIAASTFGLWVIAAPPADAAPAAAGLPCAARNPLSGSFANDLASRYPGRRFSASVIDRSGCTYGMNSDLRLGTASMVKIEFMAGVLLRAQNEGRGLTQWEQDRIWPMITESANTPASELWNYLGQDAGMQQIDAAFGLNDTQHAGSIWGNTTTSALDQARLVSEVIPGMGGPLTAPYRTIAAYYMTNVVPVQRWGASAGVPSASVVAQKNGFAGSQCCNWRINTAGWVEPPNGSGWAIVVMSDGWPTEAEGETVSSDVSARINAALAPRSLLGASSFISSSDRQDMFVRSSSGSVRQKMWTSAGGFAGWVDVGGFTTSDPDVASAGAPAFPQVFAIGGDSALWQATWGSNGWGWVSLGGICTSGPSSVYSEPNRLDVFCRGGDGALWTKTWKNTTGWSGWSSMGGGVTSDPDAASSGDASKLTVIARGGDNALWEYTFASGHWSYASLGGTCISGPGAVFSGPNRLDVYCIGTDGHPYTRTGNAVGSWTGWSGMPGLASSDPDGVSQGAGFTPRIFARGLDGAVYQWLLAGSTWTYQSWGAPP
jgi:hypothetical protein